jgi:hypothetical protein
MNTAHLPHLAMILVCCCKGKKNIGKEYIWETNWASICRTFQEPRNRFPAWRAGTTTLHVVQARQATWAGCIDFSESIPELQKRLQIRALFAGYSTASCLCVPAESWRRLHVSCQRLPEAASLSGDGPQEDRMRINMYCMYHTSYCLQYIPVDVDSKE